MKKTLITSAVSVCCFALSWIANAEPPEGVGAASVDTGVCFGQVVAAPPGNFLAFLDGVHGVMLVELGESKLVGANSANGNQNLTCHGKTPAGAVIEGFDAVTGLPATGTAAPLTDACSALTAFGLGHACRGNGNGAVIINAEFMGGECSVNGVPTTDWTNVFTPNGGVMLSCHTVD